jgi:hypothetical protein
MNLTTYNKQGGNKVGTQVGTWEHASPKERFDGLEAKTRSI